MFHFVTFHCITFYTKLLFTSSMTSSVLMMMNCFFGMVDQRKAFSLVSSQDHYQRSSPSLIFNTPRAGFEPAQNPSSGLVDEFVQQCNQFFYISICGNLQKFTLTILFQADFGGKPIVVFNAKKHIFIKICVHVDPHVDYTIQICG